MIKVGIIGSDGYSVGELYHLLIHHPDTELKFLYSPKRKGLSVAEVFNDMHSKASFYFTDELDLTDLDVLFVCLKSGYSKIFFEEHPLPDHLKVIDFSQEYRHTGDEVNGFTYGLPEANRRALTQTNRASVPGSFALSTATPLIPLAKALMLNSSIHSYSVAGKTEILSRNEPDTGITYDMLFDNYHVHHPLEHPHVEEVRHTLQAIQSSFSQELNLIPLHGSFNRGVYSTTYMNTPIELSTIREIYEHHFESHSFVKIIESYPDVRDAINTNMLYIHLSKHNGKLLIVSTLDNLLKGSAGTAVHIMNLMCGLVETTGLQMKPSIF